MDIRTVGIVGAGQMGGGIAQVAAQADLGVILYDVVPAMFERALAAMEKSLLRLKEKGRLGGRDVGDGRAEPAFGRDPAVLAADPRPPGPAPHDVTVGGEQKQDPRRQPDVRTDRASSSLDAVASGGERAR